MNGIVRIVALLFVLCQAAYGQPPTDRITRVERGILAAAVPQGETGQTAEILARMRHYGVPGVSVAVIHDGEIAWARGYGVVRAGNDQSVTPETMFQAASISKPVTALGALSLVQDGRIDLDKDVNSWLRSWKIPENDLTREDKVTLRGLLSHTSGITGQAVGVYMPGSAIPTLVQTLDGVPPATTNPVRVDNPIGTWRYSGYGYTVLQQLIIDVVDMPFPEFMRETVLRPLRMDRSTFDQSTPEENVDVARGHKAGGEPVLGGYRVHPAMSAAGLWTTASDLARFAIGIQRSIAGELESLLTPDMAHQMLTNQTESWGLGFELRGEGLASRFTHDGVNVGFDSKLVAYSWAGYGAVVMTNMNLSGGLIHEILDSVAREYSWPEYPLRGQKEYVPIPLYALESLPGRYELGAPDLLATITAKDGRLFLEIPRQGSTELFASSAESFFNAAIGWGPMKFTRDDSGDVNEMLIGYPGEQSKHRKIR